MPAGAVTVTVHVAVWPLYVAVIVAVPAATPVIVIELPVPELIETFDESLVDHVTSPVPFATVAVKVVVPLTVSVAVVLSKEILGVGSVTVIPVCVYDSDVKPAAVAITETLFKLVELAVAGVKVNVATDVKSTV